MSRVSFLTLAGGSVLLAACGQGEQGLDDPVGEVRGASLSGFGRVAEPEAEFTPIAGMSDVPSIEPADDLGEDYAEVLSDEELAKYEWIDFLELSDFEIDDYSVEGEDGGVPEEISRLDGLLVAVEGFMNPTAFDRDGVSQFTLVADPAFCCFGVTPTLHHFIEVLMPEGEFTEFFSIVPIAVFGRLEVGLVEEDGIALSFYRMTAEHVFCVY